MVDIPPSVEEYTTQSLSAIHHTLRASRRRLVIGLVAHKAMTTDYIQTEQMPVEAHDSDEDLAVTVRQLAKEIVAVEENIPLTQATGDKYHNVYTSLIQTHLPELDDASVLTYDEDRKIVAPDQNLVAVATAAAVTSPVARFLFHAALADVHSGLGSTDKIQDD